MGFQDSETLCLSSEQTAARCRRVEAESSSLRVHVCGPRVRFQRAKWICTFLVVAAVHDNFSVRERYKHLLVHVAAETSVRKCFALIQAHHLHLPLGLRVCCFREIFNKKTHVLFGDSVSTHAMQRTPALCCAFSFTFVVLMLSVVGKM